MGVIQEWNLGNWDPTFAKKPKEEWSLILRTGIRKGEEPSQ